VIRRQRRLGATGIICPSPSIGDLVIAHDPAPVYDVFKFRRFRLNLIGFLRLPLGVSETTLRDVIKGCSVNLLTTYVARAERAAAKPAPVDVSAQICAPNES
jgi:hypothetical protein